MHLVEIISNWAVVMVRQIFKWTNRTASQLHEYALAATPIRANINVRAVAENQPAL